MAGASRAAAVSGSWDGTVKATSDTRGRGYPFAVRVLDKLTYSGNPANLTGQA